MGDVFEHVLHVLITKIIPSFASQPYCSPARSTAYVPWICLDSQLPRKRPRMQDCCETNYACCFGTASKV